MKLISAAVIGSLCLTMAACAAAPLTPAQEEEVKIKSAKWMEETTQATKLAKARKFEQAEALYKSIITERQALNLDLSAQQDLLGWLYFQWGKKDLADKMFKELLAGREQTSGLDQSLLSYPLNEYASFLEKCGKTAEAKKLRSRSKAIDAAANVMPKLAPLPKGMTPEQKLAEAKKAGDMGAKLLEAELQHKALVYLNRAVELNPKDPIAVCNRGDAESWADNNAKSKQDFDTAIRLKPDYAEAYAKRAHLEENLKQYPKALADFAKAFELNPKDVESIGDRAKLQDTMGKHKEAIADYTKAIAVSPDLTWPYIQRGAAYEALKQFKNAIDDYTILCDRYPQSYDYFELRGGAFLKANDLKKSLTDFDKVVALSPKYAGGYLKRAKVYEKLDGKNSPRMVADFKKLKQLGY